LHNQGCATLSDDAFDEPLPTSATLSCGDGVRGSPMSVELGRHDVDNDRDDKLYGRSKWLRRESPHDDSGVAPRCSYLYSEAHDNTSSSLCVSAHLFESLDEVGETCLIHQGSCSFGIMLIAVPDQFFLQTTLGEEYHVLQLEQRDPDGEIKTHDPIFRFTAKGAVKHIDQKHHHQVDV